MQPGGGGGGVPIQWRLFLPVNADWKQCGTFRSGEDKVTLRVLLEYKAQERSVRMWAELFAWKSIL